MGILSFFRDEYNSQDLNKRKRSILRTVYHKNLEGSHKDFLEILLNCRFYKLIEIHLTQYRPDIPKELKDISKEIENLRSSRNLWAY